MSLSLWLCGADIRSCHAHEVGCSTAPVMSRRQFSLAIFGVWPRSRIGQVLTSCWPGGSRRSSGRDVMPVRNLPSCAHLDLVWVSLLSSGVSAMGTSVHWPEHGRGTPKVNGLSRDRGAGGVSTSRRTRFHPRPRCSACSCTGTCSLLCGRTLRHRRFGGDSRPAPCRPSSG